MKTIAEINTRIRNGKAVVVTAEEIIDIVEERGVKQAAHDIDVVTTGTFAPMCSSGVCLNVGHTKPRIKLGGGRVYLNEVPVYTGLGAVDIFLGATALPDDDPRNRVYPGEFKYGGGHVIEELVAEKDVYLTATAYGTDCYPKKKLETLIRLGDINEAVLFNPRNAYQNYNVGVNVSDKTIYTYMGVLKPRLGNANYCSAGQFSPLLNDPLYRTIGIGTRIFLGGGTGYVIWHGTQHNPSVVRTPNDVPKVPSGTIAVIGDLKTMNSRWLRGVTLTGYGVTLAVGIGVPIPILDEEMLRCTAVRDEDIYTHIVDYSATFPQGEEENLGVVNYAELRSGKIIVEGKEVPTGGLSSYAKAREIAQILKEWITNRHFLLTEYVQNLPGPESGFSIRSLTERL